MGKLTVSPSDPYFNNVELLLHMNGAHGSTTFTDSSLNGFTMDVVNATISTILFKFGGASALFGLAGYIYKDTSVDELKFPQDFCVEMWYYPLALDTNQCLYDASLLGQEAERGDAFALAIDDTGSMYLYHDNTANYTSASPIVNQWNFIAITRSGSDLRVFLNGAQVLLMTNSVNFSRGGAIIGTITETAGAYSLNGYVDDVRVTKGIARYTSSFVPQNKEFYDGKIIKNISINKQNLGGGKLRTHSNLLSNSRFDQNNDYPFDGFDANYFINGWSGGGSKILGNYYHNSPLFYDQTYRTIANKTFHEINSPYTTLLYNHALQPRLLKMFGAGSKFSGTPNNTNYLKTITNTTSYTPTDDQSWTKYGVEQIIAIPSWARKVKYGVKYLIISGDEFRFNNFGGLEIYFQKGINRSYVNLNMVRKPVSVDTTALDSLETLYTLNNYVNFDAAYANAMCQWLGPSTSKVKVRRKSSVYIDGSNLDTFNVLSDTIDIPTFSTSGGEPDSNNGFPDYISIQMFFAEWVSYLNNSGIPSGAIYFYEPFLYFTEF